ncbi:RCC1-like domain-containing protein, partial [Enterococcus faecalis]|uniref:RCC1-like domain-containing protein n=1 Tax=Enterococcus faecalis TaxID=1351 RepID=UPI00403F2BE3
MTQKTGPMILFGTNEQGILGRGDNEGVYDIDYDYGPLEKEVVADMRFGSSHALLRTCSGKLFGWGDNSRGQLGLWKNWKQTRP